ncbi:MAG: hypothetical protein AB1351_01500 [Thermoproteota archaeon]
MRVDHIAIAVKNVALPSIISEMRSDEREKGGMQLFVELDHIKSGAILAQLTAAYRKDLT